MKGSNNSSHSGIKSYGNIGYTSLKSWILVDREWLWDSRLAAAVWFKWVDPSIWFFIVLFFRDKHLQQALQYRPPFSSENVSLGYSLIRSETRTLTVSELQCFGILFFSSMRSFNARFRDNFNTGFFPLSFFSIEKAIFSSSVSARTVNHTL